MEKLMLIVLTGCATLIGCQSSDSTIQPEPSTLAGEAHNALNSLDWFGTYRGMVPCNDCEATQIYLELNKDASYMMSRNHIGKMGITVMEEGTAIWDHSGSNITIGNLHFKVLENQLIFINIAGEAVINSDGDSYSLNKQP